MPHELPPHFYIEDGTLRLIAGAEDAPPADAPAKPEEKADPPEHPEAKPEGDAPKGDTPEAMLEGDTPEGEKKPEEQPEAKSAFDTLTENLTDPAEIQAVRARLADKLPEDQREPKADTTAADAAVAEQRRREQKSQNEGKRNTALDKINAHLKDRRTKFLSDDAKPEDDYDNPLLTQAINDIVDAEIALQDGAAREAWASAIQTRLGAHGGAIPENRFKEIVSEVAQDKVKDGMIGAFLDELGDRRYQEGLAEGKAEAKSKDDAWRTSEGVAVRAEVMKANETEPDTGVNRGTSIPDPKTVAEYMALPQEQRERVGAGGNNR